MTPEQKTAIECVLHILKRKPNHAVREEQQYLSANLDDFELDSIDRLDLVLELENRFDVVFTTSAILKCRTIEEILAVIRDDRAQEAEGRVGRL
jgi:acyl carrier protein